MDIEVDYPQLAEDSGNNIAILKELGGARMLVIRLINASFFLLTWEIEEMTVRPMIFNFVSELAQSLKAGIEKVVIYDLDPDGIYSAHVVISDDRENRKYSLDLNVASALTLAVAAKCPVFVREEVFEKRDKESIRKKGEHLQKFFNDIDPDRLTKH